LKNLGVREVTCQPISSEIVEQRRQPVIVLGTVSELEAIPYIKNLNQNAKKTGLFCRFENNSLSVLDENMQPTGSVYRQDSALIAATGTGMGDMNPLWLIAGCDQSGLQRAVKYMGSGQVIPAYGWGLVLHGNEYIGLPAR
jgi:hypothetical protein